MVKKILRFNKELQDFLELADEAHKEVMSWPKWKRDLKVSNYPDDNKKK